MLKRCFNNHFRLPLCILLVVLSASYVFAQTPQFTYQGQLTDNGSPANGQYDLQFKLFDLATGGSLLGTTLLGNVQVTNGSFSVTLNFGTSQFPGADRFLEIGVRPGTSAGAYTILTPRQQLNSTPYAIRSLSAATADDLSSACVNCVTSGQINTLAGSKVTGTIPVASVPAGSNSYIQNTTSQQVGTNFSISGNGTAGGILTADSGVIGNDNSSGGYGVFGGSTSTTGIGVRGYTTASTGLNYGVSGRSDSTTGVGVRGYAHAPTGINFGVQGESESNQGYGVRGTNTGSGIGVYGDSQAGTGVRGHINVADPGLQDAGVKGTAASGGIAMMAEVTSGWGIYANSYAGGRSGYFRGDVRIEGATGLTCCIQTSALEIYAKVLNGQFAQHALAANGDVFVNGDLIATGTKNFMIDHPLDPENKILRHAAIESSEAMNIYNGNVTTDTSGEAIVILPGYFEALNRDFRYQLTTIGQFAQVIVSSKIKNNSFTIKTDKPNVEVSWQVSGIRQDASAKARPMRVEEEKPEKERGYYLNPSAYGQSQEKGVFWIRNQKQDIIQTKR